MDNEVLERARKRKRAMWSYFLLILFITLFTVWFFYWFLIRRYETATEDAYVGGNIVAVTSSVNASILSIYADKSDLVDEGQLLMKLDVAELKITLDRMGALLAQATRSAVQSKEKVVQAEEVLRLREVEQAQAALNFSHRKNLQLSGALPQEEIEKAESNLEVAVQRTRVAFSEVEEARARVEGTTIFTDPHVIEMKSRFVHSYLKYNDSKITSPVRGYVAQREVQLGEDINDGQTVMTVVPLDEVWVAANFKETQLQNLGIGQPVTLTSSAYGRSQKYKGVVHGAVPGTGVSFSLLPPQNATGNWIKIVQRVPVLIKLSEPPPEKYPLLLGLSMHVKVNTKNRAGPLLPVTNAVRTVMKTPANDSNILEGERLADAIIQQNIYE